MEIELNKPFAANSAADEDDVRQMKRSLNWLGYYTPYKDVGLSDISDTGVFKALKAFQADQNLTVTGKAKPGDETIKTLNKALHAKLNGKGQEND